MSRINQDTQKTRVFMVWTSVANFHKSAEGVIDSKFCKNDFHVVVSRTVPLSAKISTLRQGR